MAARTESRLRLSFKIVSSLIRIAVCGLLGWSCVADNPARKLRVALAALPDIDFVEEVKSHREHKRFGEGMLVVEAGRKHLTGDKRAALENEAKQLVADRDSWTRRLREFGVGAIVGEGESMEALVGAVTADFFVVGDVRDLVIQGSKMALDGDADKLIMALSAIGVFTTVVPELDPAIALFKFAKKSGSMTTRFSAKLLGMASTARATKSAEALADVGKDAVKLAEKASPGGAVRLLKHVEDTRDLKRLTQFVEHHPDGAFALIKTGDEGAKLVKTGAVEAEQLVLAAARKGDRGRAWLRLVGPGVIRPHPGLGLLKAWRAGRLEQLAERFVAEVLDPYYNYIMAGLASWLAIESVVLLSRVRRWFLPLAVAA